MGSLSVTLALALTAPFAPTHTHDRYGGQESVGRRQQQQQQQQQHICCARQEALFSPGGPGFRPAGCRGTGSRRRLRQHQRAASLSFGVGREAGAPADATAAVFFNTAGSAERGPAWCLSASRSEEALLVEPERLEGRDEGEAGTAAVQQQPTVAGAAGVADGATSARTEERPPVTRKRRPPAYWASDDNLRSEVVQFWADLGVTSDKVRLKHAHFRCTRSCSLKTCFGTSATFASHTCCSLPLTSACSFVSHSICVLVPWRAENRPHLHTEAVYCCCVPPLCTRTCFSAAHAADEGLSRRSLLVALRNA